MFQLTCTSSTAPATTVQWSKDGSPVSGGSSSQIVTDTVEATYINELTVTGGQNGTYTCNVTTWREYSGTPETVVGSPVTAMIYVLGTFVQYTYCAYVSIHVCTYLVLCIGMAICMYIHEYGSNSFTLIIKRQRLR